MTRDWASGVRPVAFRTGRLATWPSSWPCFAGFFLGHGPLTQGSHIWYHSRDGTETARMTCSESRTCGAFPGCATSVYALKHVFPFGAVRYSPTAVFTYPLTERWICTVCQECPFPLAFLPFEQAQIPLGTAQISETGRRPADGHRSLVLTYCP